MDGLGREFPLFVSLNDPQNPFNLSEDQAHSVWNTCLTLCNDSPLPLSKEVVETLHILGVGFTNIREMMDSYSAPSDGSIDSITLQSGFRENLSEFFEGCAKVASDRVGLEYAKALVSQNDEEIKRFSVEAGYTVARSVHFVE